VSEYSSADGLATALPCIDAHIHLDLYNEAERESMLAKEFDGPVAGMVAVSMHLHSSKINRSLAQRFPGKVYPAYGYHPEQPMLRAEEKDELFAWIRARHSSGEKFAIGEVGLPYYTRSEAEKNGTPFDEAPYLALLEQFAALASELDRPIILHAVYEDADKAIRILERQQVRRAHFHWFKGREETVQRMIANGYLISITPDVDYEEEIQSLVRQYPLPLLMAETDGPWPFEGVYTGRLTVPSMAADVPLHIAQIKSESAAAVANALLKNTKQFYEID